MDQAMQIAVPVLGIAAAAAVTFYVVSFNELREKSFRDSETAESEGGFESTLSSRKRRARRKADKQDKKA